MKKIYKRTLIIIVMLTFVSGFAFTGCSAIIEKAVKEAVEKELAEVKPVPEEIQPVPDELAEATPSFELTGRDWVISAQPAVGFITSYYYGLVYDPNRRDYFGPYYSAIYGGTGFVVNPSTGHVVTAAHIIDIPEVDVKWGILDQYIGEAYPDEYWNLTEEDWNWIYENFKVVGETSDKLDQEVWVQFNTATSGRADSADANYMRAEIVDFSPWEQRDIAILRIQSITGGALSSVSIGESTWIEIQDDLTIIGYPWTSDIGHDNLMNPTVTSGRISGKIILGGTEVWQVHGDAREGNSGSPVLNEKGEVIGMITMGTDWANFYLRPARDIREILNRNGVQNTTGLVDEEFKQGLINYRTGNYQEAINRFNAVLNLSGRHLLAQEYRAKAQAGSTGQ